LPHTRGSSHGQSRIIRNAYREEFLTRMANESLAQWKELEKESGLSIFTNSGMLLFADSTDSRKAFVDQAEVNLKMNGIDCKKMNADELRQFFPQIHFQNEDIGLLDTGAGTLHADVAIKAFQNLAIKHGACIQDGEMVEEISQNESTTNPDFVIVKTSKGFYQSEKVVLTPGPWASSLLNKVGVRIPLKTLRIQVCYWRETEKNKYDISHFPAFVDATGSPADLQTKTDIYGLPADEYPGHVKVCLHYGVEADPDNRDTKTNEDDVEILKNYVKFRFPYLDHSSPSITETCMYTNTPDWNFVIGLSNPLNKNNLSKTKSDPKRIIYAAGFSGQGFKMGPSVGEMLADLAEDKPTKFELKHFRPDRF